MIRVIYRWKVKKEDEAEFKAAWATATKTIRDSTLGARGSILLQSHRDPTEFVTIARWDRVEDWQAFWKDPNRTEMQTMHSLAERLSIEAYEEIENHTV